ncbi:MAG TPA: hypothetical protein VHJ34_00030 [Actinomycetota bacterium]|nr:hypothetical protein [Actinomycetota bacterium]
MLARLLRLAGLAAAALAGVWWGRVVAHSKVPPPEGRWREVDPRDLGRP